MTVYAAIFYVLAGVILVSTGLAITRRNLVHSIVYLVISFFGSAMLYYLFGAPLLAALEIIIYAGAIMLRVEPAALRKPTPRQWLPAGFLGLIYIAVTILVITTDPGSQTILETALTRPRVFGRFLFERYWLSVEIVSFLLLIALVGVLYLGKAFVKEGGDQKEDQP
jgi:NADH-quinone oxidoreductase subunit J